MTLTSILIFIRERKLTVEMSPFPTYLLTLTTTTTTLPRSGDRKCYFLFFVSPAVDLLDALNEVPFPFPNKQESVCCLRDTVSAVKDTASPPKHCPLNVFRHLIGV
jgi:hypothetical protein